jgi:predicted DNA-binding transcriptional regulator AlpA
MATNKPKGVGPDDQPLRPFLITIKTLANLLDRSEQSLARDDRKGVIPRPIKIGSSIRWDYLEILAWTKAKCPDRKSWEARETKGDAPREEQSPKERRSKKGTP